MSPINGLSTTRHVKLIDKGKNYEGDDDFARPVYSVGKIQYTTRFVESNHGVWVPQDAWKEYLEICEKYD